MHDPLLLQEIADECRTYLTLHERFAKLESEEDREEFFQREMVGSLQHLAVITVEATEEALEEEGGRGRRGAVAARSRAVQCLAALGQPTA